MSTRRRRNRPSGAMFVEDRWYMKDSSECGGHSRLDVLLFHDCIKRYKEIGWIQYADECCDMCGESPPEKILTLWILANFGKV